MKHFGKVLLPIGLVLAAAFALIGPFEFWPTRFSVQALRDSISEDSSLEGLGAPKDLLQNLRQQEKAPPVAGSVIGEAAAESSCALAESLAQDEYRILYRGSRGPPKKIFNEGFVSMSEEERASRRLAVDASLENVRRHVQEDEFPSPYVSTTRDILATVKFGYRGWVYLIRTNRGVDSMQRLLKKAEYRRSNEENLLKQGGRKLEEERLVPVFKGEQEVLIPGHIPAEEIVGAWRLLRAHGGGNPRRERLFEKFIPNPNYTGPIPVSGSICPLSFPYWDAENPEMFDPEIN